MPTARRRAAGTGWNPINPQGNFNPDIFSSLAKGECVALPNFGMETVHHVHSDDVAQAFLCAMRSRDLAAGEAFHIVSPAAMTLRGFAEKISQWFGRQPKLELKGWDEWKKQVSDKDATATWDHISHSPNCSIAKAQRLLNYNPRYSSMNAVQEAVVDMQRRGVVCAS